jgi:hypothetical protein
MVKTFALTIAAAGILFPIAAQAANYASSVLDYSPGVGYATDFSTGAGLTNAASALGEPSRSIPGPFGGPVDPFNPPYLGEQVVWIGAGGSLTVGLSAPISRDASHPFGLDFTIFGNTGFVITNGDYTGGGVTDGTLFGANSGSSVVSVSADGVNFYPLDPARGYAVDSLFPTDGSGNFDLPVNPSLAGSDFRGLDLAGIRARYAGSGGGTSFDVDWAQDGSGQSVLLPEVRFVRISVLSGAVEIDGIAGISAVPEPAPGVLLGLSLVAGFLGKLFRRSRRS